MDETDEIRGPGDEPSAKAAPAPVAAATQPAPVAHTGIAPADPAFVRKHGNGNGNGSGNGHGNGHSNGGGNGHGKTGTVVIPRAIAQRQARLKGYEGDPCPDCGQFMLVRNGTCLKCDGCGATTGCS
jgi:ribonucleoside-diphosphate reductase alpha chain